ncbi:MAG: LysR family transcriptional regulator [Paracoccaceae bacterium]
MQRDNWDNLRFVLAVAEAGTVSGAGKKLKVNHATVLRRIAQFEENIGFEIFEKTPQGYTVAEEYGQVLSAVRDVDTAYQAFFRLLSGIRVPLSGQVRITSTDSLCHALLPKIVADISSQLPDLRIHLLNSNAVLDLARIEAEITVRPAPLLPDGLVGESPATLRFGLYRMRKKPGPDVWLRLEGQLAGSLPAQWMADNLHDAQISNGANSFLTLREMAAMGMGRGILPRHVGDADPRLERIEGQMPDIAVPVWVACHHDLVNVPRVAFVRRHLVAALARYAGALSGDGEFSEPVPSGYLPSDALHATG